MGFKLRIVDAFKKSKEEKKKKLSTDKGQEIRLFPQGPREKQSRETVDSEKSSPKQPAQKQDNYFSAVKKDSEAQAVNVVGAEELYYQAVSLSREVYGSLSCSKEVIHRVNALIGRIIDAMNVDYKGLLHFALSEYPVSQDYIYYHVINVSILSCLVVQESEYDRAYLTQLGTASFFHDIGMVRFLDIINQPKKLNPEEYENVKQHPIVGEQIFKETGGNLDSFILQVIKQEHERVDGSGYPNGLKDDEISQYAQIIGLCDVYEAMVHARPYRSHFTPMETIKKILNDKKSFVYKLIKVLIEKIGIFPLGSFVHLNTKEIGVVIRQHRQLPLRPVVEIVLDKTGRRLKALKQIDLARNPTVYILNIHSKTEAQDVS